MNVTQFSTEFPNGKLLVVDDIIDTGRTFERFLEIARLKKIKFDNMRYRKDIGTVSRWVIAVFALMNSPPSAIICK